MILGFWLSFLLYNPTWRSTPAMSEKAFALGINAQAATIPASTSPRMLPSQSRQEEDNSILGCFVIYPIDGRVYFKQVKLSLRRDIEIC